MPGCCNICPVWQNGEEMIRAVIFDMFETLITHYESPLYFGAEMAKDIGIPLESFKQIWRPTEYPRSIGTMTLEDAVEKVLRAHDCYTEEMLNMVSEKRREAKRECFKHLNPEIIPMFEALKEQGFLIGLISNCFSEEAEIIRKSELFPYFDVACLSCELGVAKPDKEIFRKCVNELGVEAGVCLYVGDGGSYELETAKELGMEAVQAAWYLKKGTTQPVGRKSAFEQMERPIDVVIKARRRGCL